MAVVENSPIRLKITDSEHDSILTHGLEPDGSVVLLCFNHYIDDYAGVYLSNEERLLLVEWLTRES